MSKSGLQTPEIKGWCPGALRPMMSGDGLVVRVRPHGGRLTPDQSRGIAGLSERFGNGLIDLSSRANVQLRGVSETSHGPLVSGLRDLCLVDASTEAEARRNVVVTPFWVDGDGTTQLAADLIAALASDEAPQTPGKFGYAVDCGPEPVLRGVSADIRLEQDGRGGLILRPDGVMTGTAVTRQNAATAALSLARWFLDSGGAPVGRGRMAAHIAREACLPDAFAECAAQKASAPAPVPGPVRGGVLVGFEFGQLSAATLGHLAGCGPLRATPWRMLFIEGATVAPALSDLVTEAGDPRLRVTACTGAPACPQAQAATRPLARALAPHLPKGAHLHVSGCTKGCAHPGAAPLTLTARPGGSFDLIRNATAGDPPDLPGLTAAMLLATPSILTEATDAP